VVRPNEPARAGPGTGAGGVGRGTIGIVVAVIVVLMPSSWIDLLLVVVVLAACEPAIALLARTARPQQVAAIAAPVATAETAAAQVQPFRRAMSFNTSDAADPSLSRLLFPKGGPSPWR